MTVLRGSTLCPQCGSPAAHPPGLRTEHDGWVEEEIEPGMVAYTRQMWAVGRCREHGDWRNPIGSVPEPGTARR